MRIELLDDYTFIVSGMDWFIFCTHRVARVLGMLCMGYTIIGSVLIIYFRLVHEYQKILNYLKK